MLKINKKKNYPLTGFTLVETLVAITVLIVGVLGPLNLATRGITDGFYARNQITATYLAQEGIEIVANIVKNNRGVIGLAGDEWLTEQFSGFDLANCDESNPCGIVVAATSPNFADCGSLADCRLRHDGSRNLYAIYNSSSSSQEGPIFRREIRVIPQEIGGYGSLEEARVEVKMSWQDKEAPRSLTLVSYLYNAIP